VDHLDRDRAFPDRRGHPLDRPVATSPNANTPGMLDSNGIGGRSSGHAGSGVPSRSRSAPVTITPTGPVGWPGSQPVCGCAPIRTNRAVTGTVSVAPGLKALKEVHDDWIDQFRSGHRRPVPLSGPRTSSWRSGPALDPVAGWRYSVAMAVSGSVLAARLAGQEAARTPAAASAPRASATGQGGI
jgi:hypothetical protein